MTAPLRTPVVVVTEPDSSHLPALAWGAEEADRRHLPLELVRAQEQSTAGHIWREAVAFVESRHPRLEVATLAVAGDPVPVLRELARTAAGVVLGSCSPGTGAELCPSASVALPVIAHAHCPVVVVRDHEHAGSRLPYFVVGVDVGVDGRRHSTAAVDYAFEEASLRGAVLHVLFVWRPPVLGVLDEQAALRECRTLLSEVVASRRALHPDVEVHHRVVRGQPVRVLMQESVDALGLIVGTPRHSGFSGLPVSSVVRRALQRAQCPVIAVPRPGEYRLARVCTRVGRAPRRVQDAARHHVGLLTGLIRRGARLAPRLCAHGARRRLGFRVRGAVRRTRRHTWWLRWSGLRR